MTAPPRVLTSTEYEALWRDIKALRDQAVKDREEILARLDANAADAAKDREKGLAAIDRLAGSAMTLHRLADAHTKDVAAKVDALSALVATHVEASAERGASVDERLEKIVRVLAQEHDRTSTLEASMDMTPPNADVLGVRRSTWRQMGVAFAGALLALSFAACGVRAGVLPVLSVPADAHPASAPSAERMNYEGP